MRVAGVGIAHLSPSTALVQINNGVTRTMWGTTEEEKRSEHEYVFFFFFSHTLGGAG